MNIKYIITPEQLQRIKDLYPDTLTQTIADELKIPLSTIYKIASRNGLKKSDEFKKSMISPKFLEAGKRTQFNKNSIPSNKGKKMADYLSEESIAKIKQTQFRKGNEPHNTYEEGQVGKVRDPKGREYYKIKKNGRLLYYHIHLWLESGRTIPKGNIVVFKDGNTENLQIENLECITKDENMRRNSVHHLPESLKKLIKIKNKLTKKIKENEKSIKN